MSIVIYHKLETQAVNTRTDVLQQSNFPFIAVSATDTE